MAKERWYHGGPPGLKEILPSAQTGAPSLADYGAHAVCRRDRVYLVNRLDLAWIYAEGTPGGIVYEVQPVGDIEPDPDFMECPDGTRSVQCVGARVIGRHKHP